MVNQYMSAEEAEARSPYASTPSSSGYGGNRSSYQRPYQQQQSQNSNQRRIATAHWDQARHEWVSGPPTETSNYKNAGYDPAEYQQQQGQQLTYQQQAELNAQQRPGFTDPQSLGDINTQRRARVLASQGMTYSAAIGVVLNQQYQEAQKTPGIRDDIYYLTEGDKWKENMVERGSAYHALGMAGEVPIPANPWEYQADLAVEALKGSPGKRSEWFSPVSGEMSGYPEPMKYMGWERDANNNQQQQRYVGGVLPGGQGSQEVGWDIARTQRANPADFTKSVEYLNAAEGKYGPYGKLAGGIDNGYARTRLEQTIANRNAGNPADMSGGPVWTNKRVSEVKTEYIAPTGELPFFGVVPFVSQFLVYTGMAGRGWEKKTFDVSHEENIFGDYYSRDEKTGAYGAAYTRAFVTDKGKSDTWTYPVGAAVLSAPFAVGLPTISTRFNPATGETETITEQAYEQTSSQEMATSTLARTATVTERTTIITEVPDPFAVSDTKVNANKDQLFSLGYTIRDITQSFQKLKSGDVLGSVGTYGRGISRWTTRAMIPNPAGMGEYIETQANVGGSNPISWVVSNAAYVAEDVIKMTREEPITDVALYLAPLGFAKGESLIESGIARAAMSKGGTGVVGKFGRMMSTPLARDIGKYGIKGGMIALYGTQATLNYINAPDVAGRRKAVADVVYQLGWMGAGTGLAKEMVTFQPENKFRGVKYFSGERGIGPITTFKNNLANAMDVMQLKIEGKPNEAAYLKNKYEISKVTRFIEPAQPGGSVVEDVFDIPIEQRQIFNEVLSENPHILYGSASAYGQAPEGMRFPDVRNRQIEIMGSEAYKYAKPWEKMQMVNHPSDVVIPEDTFPMAKGADLDVHMSRSAAKISFLSKEGLTARVRIGIDANEEPIFTYLSGKRALANIAEGAPIEDVGPFYYRGAKINIDVTEIPRGSPQVKGWETYNFEDTTYTPNQFRELIGTRLLGDYFESIPTGREMYRVGDKGYSSTVENKEKLNFQSQHMGQSMRSNLANAVERMPEDPQWRGYRFAPKDVYSDISTDISLLKAERARGNIKPARELQLTKAERLIEKNLDLDLRYQLERGEEPVVGKVRDIMQIGKENLQNVLSRSGKQIGPIRTGIGVGLTPEEGLARFNVEPRTSAEQAESWLIRSNQGPGQMKAKPKGMTPEEAIAKYGVKSRTSAEQVAKFLGKIDNEPAYSTTINMRSPTVPTKPAISNMGMFSAATIMTIQQKYVTSGKSTPSVSTRSIMPPSMTRETYRSNEISGVKTTYPATKTPANFSTLTNPTAVVIPSIARTTRPSIQPPIKYTETTPYTTRKPYTDRYPDRYTYRDTYITKTPPSPPPFWLPGAGEGGGGRPFMNRGEYRWSTLNPVADIPYLSKGLGNPFPSSGGSGGGSLNAKCRHILPKLRKKCSRFLRNG